MTATNQPDRSPAPGTIPEPVHIHHGDALAAATGEQDEPGRAGAVVRSWRRGGQGYRVTA